MNRIFWYPGKTWGSQRKIAEFLSTKYNIKIRKIKQKRSFYKYKNGDVIINWGKVLKEQRLTDLPIINNPRNVYNSSNKLITFQILEQQGIPVPEYTTDKQQAENWITNNHVVVARKVVNGHGGIGIVICEQLPIPDAAFYTKHLRHKREFRVHVFKGEIIDVTEKLKRRNENANKFVRNHANGWVFARQHLGNAGIPECVTMAAIQAVAALQLDFGAVDIGYREKQNKAFVFEINTAPGLEKTTITSYAEKIKQLAE